jgi:hypothetical protein
MPDDHRPRASEEGTRAVSSGADWREEAKRICQACPARKPCLAWALNHNVASGVWGATTEEERHAIRRALIRPRNQT